MSDKNDSGEHRPDCQLYLISPLDVGGAFPDRLARALDAGPVAAFQFRVKGLDEHAAAALAEPLLRLCADRDVAFIVNDSIALAKRLGADGVHLGQGDGEVAEAAERGPDAEGVAAADQRGPDLRHHVGPQVRRLLAGILGDPGGTLGIRGDGDGSEQRGTGEKTTHVVELRVRRGEPAPIQDGCGR